MLVFTLSNLLLWVVNCGRYVVYSDNDSVCSFNQKLNVASQIQLGLGRLLVLVDGVPYIRIFDESAPLDLSWEYGLTEVKLYLLVGDETIYIESVNALDGRLVSPAMGSLARALFEHAS
jgi:hypothetical protein